MKIIMVFGLLIQLTGAWFLCRFFYKARSLQWNKPELWETRLITGQWQKRLSKFGKILLWTRGLPWEERMEPIELVADPNATFAFMLLGIGAILQVIGTLMA